MKSKNPRSQTLVAGAALAVKSAKRAGQGEPCAEWLAMKLFRDEGAVNIAAVCDVDEKRLAAAVKSAGAGVTAHRDES
jgi:hypothetical protein